MARASYKRILLKLSGEIFGGAKKYGLDLDLLRIVAKEIQATHKLGVNIAIIVGGGNIVRGVAGAVNGIDRATGDYMGMLATAINSLAIQDALEKVGVHSRVQTAIEMRSIAEPFIRRRAIRHMEKGRVVILGAGTGNPYFSTDTAAALRAMEIGAEVVIKATKVDGVYSADPVKDPNAKKYDTISYMDVLRKGLSVMDSTAISLCMDNNLPIVVFNLRGKDNIKNVARGKKIGTIVGGHNGERAKKK